MRSKTHKTIVYSRSQMAPPFACRRDTSAAVPRQGPARCRAASSPACAEVESLAAHGWPQVDANRKAGAVPSLLYSLPSARVSCSHSSSPHFT